MDRYRVTAISHIFMTGFFQGKWQVFSVHTDIVNLISTSVPRFMISISNEQIPLLPFSLKIDDYRGVDWKIGDRFKVNDQKELVTCREKSVDLFAYPLKDVDSQAVDYALEQAKDYINCSFFKTKTPINLSHVIETIECLPTHYKERNHLHIARALASLIGLGPGLTPSGDDFICGFLLGLSLDSHQIDLLPALTQALGTPLDKLTTSVSAQFIYWALRGYYPDLFLRLRCAIRDKEYDRIKNTTLSISQTGHSSGADTLYGLMVGLQAIQAQP